MPDMRRGRFLKASAQFHQNIKGEKMSIKSFSSFSILAAMIVLLATACGDKESEQLSAPTGLGVSWYNGGYRALWDTVPNARSYVLEWSTDSTADGSGVVISGSSSDEYRFSQSEFHNEPADYYFRIKATGSGDYKTSDYSNIIKRYINYAGSH
jgi:hypothetical protein